MYKLLIATFILILQSNQALAAPTDSASSAFSGVPTINPTRGSYVLGTGTILGQNENPSGWVNIDSQSSGASRWHVGGNLYLHFFPSVPGILKCDTNHFPMVTYGATRSNPYGGSASGVKADICFKNPSTSSSTTSYQFCATSLINNASSSDQFVLVNFIISCEPCLARTTCDTDIIFPIPVNLLGVERSCSPCDSP